MKVIFIGNTGENIRMLVEMETSLLAERRRRALPDKSETDMLEELVMDEEYLPMFKKLFNEAGAELVTGLSSNYLVGNPTDMEAVWREFPDFSQDTDFALWLNMHDDWPMQYKKSVEVKVQQYLVDNVCYRWLVDKSPDDAGVYFGRMGGVLQDIQRLLVRKGIPMRRLPSFP